MPRILVADDNTNIQKMVTLAFQERGVEVIAVGNGEAAVRRIPDANPDLVLADVFMPVRNGYEVCEFVKKDSRFSQIPVILLVGAFDPLDEKEARRVGADGVLKKPFVPPDPLIAMVMSALEKSPRVIAELAKAKEAAAAEALRPAALEAPAKAEPKPLPHYPEPTPEEAAVIYGFGKGLRGIDGEEAEEATQAKSTPTPKAAESKGPKIASGSKVSVAGDDDEEDAGYDDVSTATDRRRQNTDFEVPDNVSADPIYSYGRDFEPITFPSEKDVPPKHVKSSEIEAEASAQSEAVASADHSASAPSSIEVKSEAASDAPTDWDIRPESAVAASSTSSAPSYPESSTQTEDEAEQETASVNFENHPAVELVTTDLQAEEAPVPFSISSSFAPTVESADESVAQSEPVSAWKSLPKRVFEAPQELAPASHAGSTSEQTAEHAQPESASSASHGWLDNLTSSDTAKSHWTSNIDAQASTSSISNVPAEAEAPAPSSALLSQSWSNPSSAFSSEPVAASPVEAAPEISAASNPESRASEQPIASASEVETESHASKAWTDEFAALPTLNLGSQFETEPRNFSETTPQFGSSSYHFASSETASQEDHLASIDSAETAPVVEASSHELMVSPADASRNGDAQPHVPSEPLFVAEDRQETNGYSSHQEGSEPTHHEAVAQTESAFSEHLDSHTGVLESTPTSLYDGDAATATSEEFTERIPTLPPANREALSDIAFLMPPPVSHESHASSSGSSESSDSSSVDVDDVVRKVLEKLQPQLQQMLSQGMKPLLENLVQNELQKKER